MDILTIVQAVIRRWYLTLPIILMGLGGAYFLDSSIPPEYEANGQVLLANPELDPTGLPSALVDVDDVVARINAGLIDDEVDATSGMLRATSSDPSTLQLTVLGDDQEAVERVARNVVEWYGGEVDTVQSRAGIPEDERLRLDSSSIGIGAEETEGGDFEVRTAIALRDPTAGSSNPFGASNTTIRILTVAVQSDSGRQVVNSRTADGVGFELDQSSRDSAPILRITTYGSDPEGVIAAFDEVLEVFASELEARQDRAEVPTTRRTRLEVLAAPTRVSDVSPPLDRSVAAIIGVAGIIAVALAIAVESIASRRRVRDASQELDWFQSALEPDPLIQRSDQPRSDDEGRRANDAVGSVDSPRSWSHPEERSTDASRTPS